MASVQELNFDNLLNEFGAFGRYQMLHTFWLCLWSSFASSWPIYNLVFMLYTPEKKCAMWNVDETIIKIVYGNGTPECEIQNQYINETKLQCKNWTYDKTYFDSTVVTQWDMVCDKEFWAKNVIGLFTLCGVVGAAFMSIIQDYFGRKIAFLVSLTFIQVGGCFSLLAHSYLAFVLVRCIVGTQFIASYNVGFVWAQEIVDASKRTLVNFLLTLMYAVSTISVGLVAYACRTWIQIGMTTSLPFFALYAYVFLLDESPRWLLSVHRLDEAARIVHKIAIRNGKSTTLEYVRDRLRTIMQKSDHLEQNKKTKVNVLDLFKSWNLRCKTIFITVTYIANALVYNSMAFNAENLGNLYAAYIMQAAVEAPACVIIVLLANKCGRILPMSISMLFSAVFSFMCIPAYMAKWNTWCVIIFAALSKFGICISYNILYQVSGELYPTTLRGTGVAFSCIVSDLFTVAMPFILRTGVSMEWMPMLILGLITTVATVCSFLLPETMKKEMPQNAKEAENDGRVGMHAVREHLTRLTWHKVKF